MVVACSDLFDLLRSRLCEHNWHRLCGKLDRFASDWVFILLQVLHALQLVLGQHLVDLFIESVQSILAGKLATFELLLRGRSSDAKLTVLIRAKSVKLHVLSQHDCMIFTKRHLFDWLG